MFRFYKTILNLKTKLQEQNQKKILIFFHYHLNLFICYMKHLTVCFHYLWLTKEYRLKTSIFYSKNILLRISYIWKTTTSSTPRPPLHSISCLKKFYVVSLRIQSSLEVMKIRLPRVDPYFCRVLSLLLVFLFTFSLLQTP